MTKRWVNRPDGSNWGDFGEDDQLGRINLLTADRVRAAAAEIQTGQNFCLSLPLDYPGGNVLNARRYPPALSPTEIDGEEWMNMSMGNYIKNATDVICDDQVLICLQYSTQWDSLAHVGSHFDADGDGEAEKVFYNGFRAGEHILGPDDHTQPGALNLSIDNFAANPIQGRGVLVDLSRHYGRERKAVNYEDLMGVMEKDGVVIEEGDILMLRTGFSELILEMDHHPDKEVLDNSCAALDGLDDRLLQWITDSGIAAICADNYAVENFLGHGSETPCSALPLHQHCLFKLGLPLAELWYFAELAEWMAENNRNRCFLTAPPLRLPKAVGSPATPVATV
jgi:kynurenine formamidase